MLGLVSRVLGFRFPFLLQFLLASFEVQFEVQFASFPPANLFLVPL